MASLADALSVLTPPADPRSGLPAFGQLPAVARLDDVTWRVLAPNPSPMTLDGTNTYVVADLDHAAAAIVDPGPSDADHLARVAGLVAELDVAVTAVVSTHHHHDHAEAVVAWAAHFAAAAHATTPETAGPGGIVVAADDEIDVGSHVLRAVATPGHCADHVAFRAPSGALLAGDHVLGRGTSVVAHPDGDLEAYLASLRRVLDLGPDALYPGHGPELMDDPSAVLRYYLDHRAFRERQVLTVLQFGPATPGEIVAHVYADVDRQLWPAAEASTRACLRRLQAAGTVAFAGDVVRLTAESAVGSGSDR